jgi:hypothetical protein
VDVLVALLRAHGADFHGWHRFMQILNESDVLFVLVCSDTPGWMSSGNLLNL